MGDNSWIGRIFGGISRGLAKGKVRRTIKPYIEELIAAGFTQEQLEFLVANGHSFYRQTMPKEWKEEFISWAKENIELVEAASQDEEEVQLFLIEIMTEIAPCFVEVVTYDRRAWLSNEFQEILKDIRNP